MQKIFLLIFVLVVSACGGGSGTKNTGQNTFSDNTNLPENINITDENNNFLSDDVSVTILPKSADNSDAIKDYIVSRGVNSDYPVLKLRSLYYIAESNDFAPTYKELKDAFLLAGGDNADFDPFTAKNFIKQNYEKVLDRFFNKDDKGYIFEPKMQSITDIEFYTGFEVWFKFNVKDDKIVSIRQINLVKDPDFDNVVNEFILNRDNDKENSFSLSDVTVYTLSEYARYDMIKIKKEIQKEASCYIDILSDYVVSQSELTPEQVKQKLAEQTIDLLERYSVMNDILRKTIREKFASIDDDFIINYKIDKSSISIDSIGKEIGLSFSDFGHTTTDINYIGEDKKYHGLLYAAYSGGYESKVVEKPSEDMVFNGKAVAAISVEQENDYNKSLLAKTDFANLTLKDGTETLVMEFSKGTKPWYDIIIGRTENDHENLQRLDILNSETTGNMIDPMFRMTDSMVEEAKTNYMMEIEYFGNSLTPTEAIGFVETKATTADDKKMYVTAAFGGKP